MVKTFIKKHKESINFYLGILFIGSVIYIGPKFSKWYGENEKKKIDKNGKIVRGYVLDLFHIKGGNQVKVEYEYNDKKYINDEIKNNKHFQINDLVDIVLDTIEPENSYIINFDSE